MTEFKRSAVRAGVRERKKITIVILCALAAGLTLLRAEAESPNGTSQAGTPSLQLLAARSKQGRVNTTPHGTFCWKPCQRRPIRPRCSTNSVRCSRIWANT